MAWRDELDAPCFAPADFKITWSHAALVVIDLQHLDAHRHHGVGPYLREVFPDLWDYYFRRVEGTVIPNVRRLLGEFRDRGLRVVYLTLGAELPDGADLPPLRRPERTPWLRAVAHRRGSLEHRILPQVAARNGELVVNKVSRSPFNSTAIERTLRNLGIDTLILTGVTTSACVETTARDASDRGFQVVVVEDAVAEYDPVSHDASLRLLALRWAQIWTTTEARVALHHPRGLTVDSPDGGARPQISSRQRREKDAELAR